MESRSYDHTLAAKETGEREFFHYYSGRWALLQKVGNSPTVGRELKYETTKDRQIYVIASLKWASAPVRA